MADLQRISAAVTALELKERNRQHQRSVSIHWFRHGLRLHDNPALLESLNGSDEIYPIFIFDGKVAGSDTAKFNRMRFFLESIKDLDEQLKLVGGRIFAFRGQPHNVLKELFKKWKVTRVTFEEEPEAIWHERDQLVRDLCASSGVQCVTRVSHTLWDPKTIFKRRKNIPPLTYDEFCQVAKEIGDPPRPCPLPDFSKTKFVIGKDHDSVYGLPTAEELGVLMECSEQVKRIYIGGEQKGLELFEHRMKEEQKALDPVTGNPSFTEVNLLASPTSLSAYLRYGCISVRKFFWAVHDLFDEHHPGQTPPLQLTGQLLWREFFYVMSHRNLLYDKMIGNPVCLQIPWYTDADKLSRWVNGTTGFPWIDAGMRQLKQEGWIHHVVRHATACFLTRGDLWLNWEEGAMVFYQWLVDGDWAVNSGNWMWVSSSAFEKALESPVLLDPVLYGQQMDPTGEYVRKYVPEVKNLPFHLLFCPWKADEETQKEYGCILGKDYPHPCVNHDVVFERNAKLMEDVRFGTKLAGNVRPQHVSPSSVQEIMYYVRLPESLMESLLIDMLVAFNFPSPVEALINFLAPNRFAADEGS